MIFTGRRTKIDPVVAITGETTMKDLESETALNFAHAIADLIQAADESALRDGTIQEAGCCIVQLLDVVQADYEQQFNTWQKGREAEHDEEEAAKEHRDCVATYLSPRTSPETRTELEPMIQASDITHALERNVGIQENLQECLGRLGEEKQFAQGLLAQHQAKDATS